MAMLAGTELPLPLDLNGRSFALLDQAERARLAGVLRPLPWIDGLVTAVLIAPEEPDDWMAHIWCEGNHASSAASETADVSTVVDEHLIHVADALYDDPDAYRPYLGGAADQMDAAAQWSAGFRFGIRLLPEAWEPLIADEDTRALLAAILSLERDEDPPKDAKADSPFRDMPVERREHLRRATLEILPEIVLSLHDYALGLCDE